MLIETLQIKNFAALEIRAQRSTLH